MIPRIFHRIWLGNSPMPPEHEEFGRSWARLHPNWEMKLWTEENLLDLVNQDEYDRSKTYSGKSNVARYEILYRYGGVYIDTDFECLQSIEPLLQNCSFMAGYSGLGLVNNALIACTVEHPLMKQCVDCLPVSYAQNSERKTFHQSGPYFFTDMINQYRINNSGRNNCQDILTLPPKLLYPYTWEQRHIFQTEVNYSDFQESYALHHWESSWRREIGKPDDSAS